MQIKKILFLSLFFFVSHLFSIEITEEYIHKANGFDNDYSVDLFSKAILKDKLLDNLSKNFKNYIEKNDDLFCKQAQYLSLAELKNVLSLIATPTFSNEKKSGNNYFIKGNFSISEKDLANKINILFFENSKEIFAELEDYKQSLSALQELNEKIIAEKNQATKVSYLTNYYKLIQNLTEETLYLEAFVDKLFGNYSSAKEKIEQILILNENSAKSLNLLGEINFLQEKDEDAINLFVKANEKNKNFGKAYYNLAKVFLKKNNFVLAHKNNELALELSKNNLNYLDELSLIYFAENNLSKAMDFAQKIFKLDSFFTASYNTMAKIYDKKEDYEKAIQMYEKLSKLNPLFNSTYNFDVAGTYYKLALKEKIALNYDLALKHLAQSIKFFPDYYQAYDNIADIYKNINQLDSAKNYYSRSIEINPRNPKPYNSLGEIYLQEKKDELALKNFLTAIDCDEKYILAYQNLGRYYSNIKDFEKAEEYYNQIIKIKPEFSQNISFDFAQLYNNLALKFLDEENYSKSEEYFKKALKKDENFSEIYYNLGLLYAKLNNHKKALEYYDLAISQNEKFLFSYLKAANSCLILEDILRAKKYLLKAMELDKYNVWAISLLGECELSLNNFQEAINYEKKAIALDENNAKANYLLAKIYFMINNYKSAKYYLEKAMQIEKNYLFYNLSAQLLIAEKKL